MKSLKDWIFIMENFLIDTNVLIYAINKDSEFHQSSRKLFETKKVLELMKQRGNEIIGN